MRDERLGLPQAREPGAVFRVERAPRRLEWIDEASEVCVCQDAQPDEQSRPRLALGLACVTLELEGPSGETVSVGRSGRMLLGRVEVGELVVALSRWLRTGSCLPARVDTSKGARLVEALVTQLERHVEGELGIELWGEQREGLRRRVRQAVREALG